MSKTLEIEDGIFVEKNLHGHYVISTMIDGQRVSKTFIFYTLDQAVSLFQQWIEEGIY
jgi:hypothetical protein